MATTRLATKSVDSIVANAAYAELAKFVESRSSGVVDKKPDTALAFECYLKATDPQKTNALVTDFLNVSGASRITLLAYPHEFHLTNEVPERRQETRRRIPRSRRRSTGKVIHCARLRSTDQEKEHGVGDGHNISCARPAVLWEWATEIRERS